MNRRIHLLLLLAILLPVLAAGNGKYVTSLVVGEDPAIPVQRAAIRFADGVQTLVVESTFVADEAAEVAWILPLPAVPTEFDVASPGLIETMAFQFGPGIHQPIRIESMWIEAFTFLFLMLLAVGFAFSHRMVEWVLVSAIIGLLALIAVPNFLEAGTRGSGSATDGELGTLLLERRIVGDYDVAVLTPATSQEMADWLSANGFGELDDGLHATIENHIRDGWCFTAARLAGEIGINSPAPLSVTFQTDRAVYPMRLTGQGATSNTLVDLFVFGPGMAKHDGMSRVVSGTLDWERETGPDPRRWRTVGGRDTRGRIATMHRGVIEFAGDSTVMTRLSRSFTPEEMRSSDLELDFDQVASSFLHRQMLHPESNRLWMMARWAMGFIVLGSLLGATLWRIKAPIRATAMVIAGLVAGALSAGMVAVSGNYVPVREHSTYTITRGGYLEYALHRMDPDVLDHVRETVESMDDMMEALLAHGTNTYTGAAIREMDSPGNFIRRTREDGERVIVGMSLSGEEREHTWEMLR